MNKLDLPLYPELFEKLTDDESAVLLTISHGGIKDIDQLLLRCFAYAVTTKSSDIHITGDKYGNHIKVRINIRTPKGIKYLKYMGISEARHFENKIMTLSNIPLGGMKHEMVAGRFSMDYPSWWASSQDLKYVEDEPYKTDIRVQYQKTGNGGFSIVCRILDQQRAPALHELGLTAALEAEIKKTITLPSGMVVASGPTGSGKTTLLNAMLKHLNDGTRSIFTIEDPIEYRQGGNGPITQIQVHGEITMAVALKAALRSDPDVILIGEIRDSETMEIALQAAQTGHMVLTTIHANGAPETFGRMIDLTLDKTKDAFRVADTLKMVLAQRLLPRYDKLPVEREVTNYESQWMKENGAFAGDTILETTATEKIGVAALVESIKVDHAIKKVLREPIFDSDKVYQLGAEQLQFETLTQSGLRYVENGTARISDCQTTLETNLSAGATESARTRFCREYGLTYQEVSTAIDEYYLLQEQNIQCDLFEVLMKQKEKKNAA